MSEDTFPVVEAPFDLRTTTGYAYLGPIVQSIVSLTSSLVVKMLTVLISTISNSQLFLMKKM